MTTPNLTPLKAIAVAAMLSSCSNGAAADYKDRIIEVNSSDTNNGRKDIILIAGNGYSSPVIPNQPHLLKLHYAGGAFLYVDEQGQREQDSLFVYIDNSSRAGITKELPINNRALVPLLKRMDDPVAELLHIESDGASRPFWIRFRLHDASLDRTHNIKAPLTPECFIVDLIFEKKQVFVTEANKPEGSRLLSPEQYRPENMLAYESKTYDTFKADIFDGDGKESFLSRNEFKRKMRNFMLWRTVDEFEHGIIASSGTLSRDGNVKKNIVIDGKTRQSPAYWAPPYVIKVHAGGNSNLYLYPDISAPNITLIDVANKRTYHANIHDKGMLKQFLEKLCQMRDPLLISNVTFNPGESSNTAVTITWMGKSNVPRINSEPPNQFKSFEIKIDIRRGEAGIDEIK